MDSFELIGGNKKLQLVKKVKEELQVEVIEEILKYHVVPNFQQLSREVEIYRREGKSAKIFGEYPYVDNVKEVESKAFVVLENNEKYFLGIDNLGKFQWGVYREEHESCYEKISFFKVHKFNGKKTIIDLHALTIQELLIKVHFDNLCDNIFSILEGRGLFTKDPDTEIKEQSKKIGQLEDALKLLRGKGKRVRKGLS